MTDLTTKPEFGADADEPNGSGDQPVQWAPAEPKPKNRTLRLALWIGIPSALVLAGAGVASAVLIAPGTSIAGVPVGFMTAGAATDAVQQRLASSTVTLGDGGSTVSASDLGATVDADALAKTAFEDRPLWNVSQWFGDPIDAPVTLDADAATAALTAAAPDLYIDATPAAVSFDGAAYVVTPAVDGEGVDVDALRTSFEQAFDAGTTAAVVEPEMAPVPSTTTTAKADGIAQSLNGMLANVGFYVGEERTVPVDAATAASWITVTAGADGEFAVTADPAKIQGAVDGLKPLVDRAPVNGTVITDSDGTVLETTVAGADGRVLGDTTNVAQDFATQLASGNGVYSLPVEVTPVTTTTLARLLEVDLSEQRLYMKENGVVVDSWAISSGESRSPTITGHFKVNSHYTVQTMSSTSATDPYWNYEVPNIRWIMYFNGSQAFHGVYWHNNFGTPMSHGCVGMPNARAKQIYDWSPNGVDVWIHS
ncbi:L,D-transpeptidase family protein [Microbacterium telephonicum]|uniref:L,D-transpeptidase family protein n=1 Tax=Microbacterium telephonicum TaxID=1714841 RepID=UPI001F5438E7|nr:L,D-transpeptidase family protein [Microbacterium telephonicum]